MNLPANTTSSTFTQVDTETRHVYHATAPVYYPAPGGATYVNSATCTHDHPDTREGWQAAQECATRLARIIQRDKRIPKWATLALPIPTDVQED